MTYLSLFTGAGGTDQGLQAAGCRPLGFCEIDPRCSDVLRHCHPDVPNYRQVEAMQWLVRNGYITEFPDLVAMSPPCQDLSTAGLRAGLSGARSGLFFDAIRFLRCLVGRGWRGLIVMEQVPGLLSSDEGGDMAEVLRAFQNLGAMDVGWRVLDGQFFGVPQRRRRIFFVVDLGGTRAEQILALAEGLRGNSKASDKEGTELASSLTGGFGTGGADNNSARANHLIPALARTITSREGLRQDESAETLVCCVTGGVTHALTANGADASEDGTGRGTPIIWQQQGSNVGPVGTLLATDGYVQRGNPFTLAYRFKSSEHTGLSVGPTSPCLGAGRNGEHAVAFDPNQITSPHNRSNPKEGDPCPTLSTFGSAPVIAFVERSRDGERSLEWTADVAACLTTHGGGARSTYADHRMVVRRLMPVECEELMGWERDRTRWGFLNPVPNSPAIPIEEVPLFWEKWRPSVLQGLVAIGVLSERKAAEGFSYLAKRVRWPDGREAYEIPDVHRFRMCGNGVISHIPRWMVGNAQRTEVKTNS